MEPGNRTRLAGKGQRCPSSLGTVETVLSWLGLVPFLDLPPPGMSRVLPTDAFSHLAKPPMLQR